LDEERSHLTRHPDDYFIEGRRGKVSGIRRAVLQREALIGYDIIRLSGNPVHLYVSERFRNVFWHGFTGYSFQEVDLSDGQRRGSVRGAHG
jgi:hypothetical protein